MQTVIIIDDEQHSIDSIEALLNEAFADRVKVIGGYTDPIVGILNIKERKPDIVLLDIQFPNTNGIEIAKLLKDEPTYISFITMNVSLALEAMQTSELPYILKPPRTIDFEDLLLKYKKREENGQYKISTVQGLPKQLDNALGILERDSEEASVLFINTADVLNVIPFDEICYMKSDQYLTKIYKATGDVIVSTRPIAYYNDLLKNKRAFYRCHRSYIVNIDYISQMVKSRKTNFLTMKNGDVVEVSTLRKSHFNEYLQKYSKGK
ncbi:MAG: response regulator transcription factor [Bacteroidetes bacterium]|nr:response regulator transcription factor [Bacteroidota bacterium]